MRSRQRGCSEVSLRCTTSINRDKAFTASVPNKAKITLYTPRCMLNSSRAWTAVGSYSTDEHLSPSTCAPLQEMLVALIPISGADLHLATSERKGLRNNNWRVQSVFVHALTQKHRCGTVVMYSTESDKHSVTVCQWTTIPVACVHCVHNIR